MGANPTSIFEGVRSRGSDRAAPAVTFGTLFRYCRVRESRCHSGLNAQRSDFATRVDLVDIIWRIGPAHFSSSEPFSRSLRSSTWLGAVRRSEKSHVRTHWIPQYRSFVDRITLPFKGTTRSPVVSFPWPIWATRSDRLDAHLTRFQLAPVFRAVFCSSCRRWTRLDGSPSGDGIVVGFSFPALQVACPVHSDTDSTTILRQSSPFRSLVARFGRHQHYLHMGLSSRTETFQPLLGAYWTPT